jgi:regulator of replication initiation timing
MNPEEFAKRDQQYTVVIFHLSEMCVESETGTSWQVLVRDNQGELSKYWATNFTYINSSNPNKPRKFTFGNKAIAVIDRPRSELLAKQARTVLLAHCDLFCYTIDGQERFCADKDKFDWHNQATAFDHPAVMAVQRGDKNDQKLMGIYREALEVALVKKYGTSMSKDEFENLKNIALGRQAGKWINRTVPPSAQFATTAALANFIVAGSMLGVSALAIILAELFAPPDVNYPEYCNGLASNRTVAVKVIGLKRTIRKLKLEADQQIAALADKLEQQAKENQALQTRMQEMQSQLDQLKTREQDKPKKRRPNQKDQPQKKASQPDLLTSMK